MPHFISQAYATLLLEHCQQLGHPTNALGLPDPLPARLPLDDWRRALAKGARTLRDPLLGLTIGQRIEPRHFGVVGYVTQQCPTLLEAVRQVHRFLPLINDASPMELQVDDRELVLRWPDCSRHYDRLIEQLSITVAVSYVRRIATRPVRPVTVHLTQDAQGQVRGYEKALGCPVVFGCTDAKIVYARPSMAVSVRQPDASLLAVLQQHAEKMLAELPRRDDFLDELQVALVALVRERHPTVAMAGRQLGISGRSLQRRLEQRGLHFQMVLDETRVMLAKNHLRDRALRITDVAMLLGYSEQSAFDRAFRRWTGLSPGTFRRDAWHISQKSVN